MQQFSRHSLTAGMCLRGRKTSTSSAGVSVGNFVAY